MATLVSSEMFDIQVNGQTASRDAVFPSWEASDRFGIVIDEPFGGLGASQLIQLATSMFYDAKPSRRGDRKVYPEIYALHYGRGFGAHAPFDFWPARREAIVAKDPQALLDAINDRGITRLAIPDRPARVITHRPKEEDAAEDRIASAFIYSASGRTEGSDVSIRANDRRAELNTLQVLSLAKGPPAARQRATTASTAKERDTSYYDWIETRKSDTDSSDLERAKLRRKTLQDAAGLSTETYRFVNVADALKRL